MKLHLPKQLFTALLAAITFAAIAPFTQAAEYTGTFGWAGSDDTSTTDVDESVLRLNFADGSGLSVTDLSPDKSYKSTNSDAATNAFTPDQNIGNAEGNNWTLSFTYTFEDTDVASATLNSITFDAFLFNGAGNPQDDDTNYARPVKFTLTQDSTTVAEETVAYANCGSDWDNDAVLETTGVTLIGEGTESTTKTYALTASNAQENTTYGTFVGLRSMTFNITATINSGADVTWTNGTNATWSGESWKTAAGTIGTMADADVGNATFADAAGGSHTVTVDAAATAKSIAVNSGNYTFSGTGSLSITNEDVTNDGYSLNIAAGASATFNVATTLAGTVNLAANTTLTLGGGTSEAPVTHSIGTVNAAGTTTIQLNDYATLNKITTTGSDSITLKGSGVYDLGSVTELGKNQSTTFAAYLGVTVADNWTGTIKLTGTASGAYLNHKGSTGSWLQLDGLTGWFAAESDVLGTHTANLNLTGNGLIVDDNSKRLYKHTGAIKGSGNYTIQTKSENAPSYEFIGDLSEWAGAFVVKEYDTDADNPDVTLNLTNGGTLYSGAGTSGIRMEREGTLTVNIGNADSAGAVGEEGATGSTIMRGAISNTSSGTLNLNVKGSTAFAQNVTVTSMTVDAGKTATLSGESNSITAGNVTISQKDASLSNVTVQGSSISATATDGTKGSISNANVALAQLAEDASFTIQDMTLTNTTITAATPTTQVKLQNVAATNLALAQGKFTMNAAPTVGTGGTTANFGTNTDSSFMISKLTAGSASLTLNLDVMGAYESTGAVDNVTLTITLAGITGDVSSYGVDAWKALVGFEESSWLGHALVIQKAEYTVVTEQTEQAPATAGESGVPTVSYSVGNVGSLVITIAGLNVPEPASATLGLAALMMLCSRRRRKA